MTPQGHRKLELIQSERIDWSPTRKYCKALLSFFESAIHLYDEVTGKTMNRGGDYDLEVPVIYYFTGPVKLIENKRKNRCLMNILILYRYSYNGMELENAQNLLSPKFFAKCRRTFRISKTNLFSMTL